MLFRSLQGSQKIVGCAHGVKSLRNGRPRPGCTDCPAHGHARARIVRTLPDSVKQAGSKPDPRASSSWVKGSRLARRWQRMDSAASLRVFASSRASKCKASHALEPWCMQRGFLPAETRRRGEYGLMDAHAEVHVHPLRPRGGTKPAATRPLADREVPFFPCEDLKSTRAPARRSSMTNRE